MADEREQSPLDPARVELLSRAARAARELCELLWEAMHQELRHPREERVRELSQRLSEVSSTVAMLTVAPQEGNPSGERRTPPEPIFDERSEAPPVRLSPVLPSDAPSPAAQMRPQAAAGEPASPAAQMRPQAAAGEPASPAAQMRPHAAAGDPPSSSVHMRLVDEHEPSSDPSQPSEQPSPPSSSLHAPSSPSVHAPPSPPIQARDVRREEGPSAWVSTVGRLLERHALDGLPFSVLLVEVVDVAHIERTESPVQVSNLIAQVEGALERALRTEDTLTRESFGRYWLVAPETNGTGARMLAERLARLVRSSASHRGVPLEVAVGIAVCPEDGAEAPALAARADLGVYSARATGRPVARAEPPV